jgi:hypothetical protein
VTTWPEAHRRAAVLAAELHSELGINLDRPVDVFDAVRRLGIVLAFRPLGRLSGVYLPGSTPGILLHSGHPRTRQRYTASHELGHHRFGHAAEIDLDIERLLRTEVERWPDREKEAEAFGAWFLMPRRLIRVGLADLGIDEVREPIDVYSLSLWLGTSYTATARQLASTRLATENQAVGWARVPPRDLKQMLVGNTPLDDMRYDVWWVDDRGRSQWVDVRPGDRVVLSLEEIPSSGFMWRVVDVPPEVRVVEDSAVDDWEPGLFPPGSIGELTGESCSRAFLLEIDASAGPRSVNLMLVKDQAWDRASDPADRFELAVAIHPALLGVQLPPEALALHA